MGLSFPLNTWDMIQELSNELIMTLVSLQGQIKVHVHGPTSQNSNTNNEYNAK